MEVGTKYLKLSDDVWLRLERIDVDDQRSEYLYTTRDERGDAYWIAIGEIDAMPGLVWDYLWEQASVDLPKASDVIGSRP